MDLKSLTAENYKNWSPDMKMMCEIKKSLQFSSTPSIHYKSDAFNRWTKELSRKRNEPNGPSKVPSTPRTDKDPTGANKISTCENKTPNFNIFVENKNDKYVKNIVEDKNKEFERAKMYLNIEDKNKNSMIENKLSDSSMSDNLSQIPSTSPHNVILITPVPPLLKPPSEPPKPFILPH